MFDLRVVRLVATVLFFLTVIAMVFADQLNWKYIVGALLFGGMALAMWWADLQAQADLRADNQRMEQKARLERLRGQQGPSTGTMEVVPPNGPHTSWH